MPRKPLTTEDFIQKAKQIHEDKYDYSLVEYKHSKQKVKIVCPVHGIFLQTPNNHLRRNGCPICSLEKQKLSLGKFIKKAHTVHKNKYDYTLVEYKNTMTKVKIICPEHGVFEQTPNSHLRGQGCPECGIKKLKSSLEEFIEKAKFLHGDKYNYSLVEYENSYTKVKIICPIHGEFLQRPDDHLKGYGCPKCPITISKPERELADFIFSLGHEIIQSYRGWCPERPQLEIDIYIPELNVGFEFNGNYWHSLRDKNYHKEKTIMALNNNIKLIHIWEKNWTNKRNSVIRMIENRLNKHRGNYGEFKKENS